MTFTSLCDKSVRALSLRLLLVASLLLSGCAANDEAARDEADTYQAAPEKPEDGHGWGANVQGLNK